MPGLLQHSPRDNAAHNRRGTRRRCPTYECEAPPHPGVFESSAKWQGYLGSEEISACTQVKSTSAFLHKVSEEEELKKETATLKAGTHYRAGSRAEELSCVETAAEW